MYEEKDLISFGSYLLSDERNKRILETPGLIPVEERKKLVHDADLKNWNIKRDNEREFKLTIKQISRFSTIEDLLNHVQNVS